MLTALRDSPVTVAYMDQDLRYDTVYNPPAGLRADMMLGKTDEEIFRPAEAARLTALKRQVLQEKQGVHDEVAVTIAGMTIYLDIKLDPWLDNAGVVRGVTYVAVEVTKLVNTLASLAQSEERFRTAVDNMLDSFTILTALHDTQGEIVDFQVQYANPAAHAGNRLAFEEQTERRLSEVVPAYRSSGLFARYCEVVESREPMVDEEFTFDEHNGKENPAGVFAIRATALGDGLATSWRDVTEAKRMEQDIRRSNRELEQFAYAASHDLQEPLRASAGFLQLLERRYSDQLDADARRLIARSVAASQRLRDLVEGLLSLSLVTTRGGAFKPVDMEQTLEAAVDSLSATIEESGAVITHDQLPTIQADPVQMEQVLRNLVGNAIKFRGAEAPRVHVRAEEQESGWIFSVRDNGIGIDPRFADRIFVVFQRLHTRDEYPGHGLGLAISQRIVERHGGRIWVESEEGNGATFRFSIPDQGGFSHGACRS
ncbi:MAG: sensor histidine kinase [Anaerolineae bacterium]